MFDVFGNGLSHRCKVEPPVLRKPADLRRGATTLVHGTTDERFEMLRMNHSKDRINLDLEERKREEGNRVTYIQEGKMLMATLLSRSTLRFSGITQCHRGAVRILCDV